MSSSLAVVVFSPDAAVAFGWALVLTGFLIGAGLGLRFHDERFLGGYASLRRRLVRLGHIACIALGVLLVEIARTSERIGGSNVVASCFGAGAFLMPTTCFLAAWRPRFRLLFVLPVAALVVPVAALLVELVSRAAGGASP